MKWIRTTKRLPNKADADWDGSVVINSPVNPEPVRVPVRWLTAKAEDLWWLEGYRTERPVPPKENDE